MVAHFSISPQNVWYIRTVKCESQQVSDVHPEMCNNVQDQGSDGIGMDHAKQTLMSLAQLLQAPVPTGLVELQWAVHLAGVAKC
jgi:hypothetical protein